MADLDITNELKLLREEKTVISNQVKDLETKNAALKEGVDSLKAENKTLCEQIAVVNTQKAEILIKSLVDSGKLKKEGSEKWVVKATENYDLVNECFGAIEAPKNDFFAEELLNVGSKQKKLSDMNDEETEAFAISNPEAYNKLILNDN